ncbi:hypothetical protein LUZ60_013531 [Juncus effusus]|nr:hypothetical protein LUZ60_013531 [Juncus effusus]
MATTEETTPFNQEDDAISSVASAAPEEGELEEGEIEPPALHPLEHGWTLWFDNPSGKSRQAAWGSSIKPVYTVSTVEDFWCLYNNINPPSKLVPGADLHLFKNKIEPKWEDPICSNGGKWTINCSRGKSDTYWLYTLLGMIGEQFEYGDEICGVVVNVRAKQERISIWTKDAHNEAAQVSIGRQWKEMLECKDSIGFLVHDDVKRLDKNAKNRYSA